MNKGQLIDAIAKDTELSKAAAGRALESAIKNIQTTVAKGGEVVITGFGSFKGHKRAARNGRNPRTGATVKIAATKVPRFKAGATFKAAVANKRK